MTAHVIKVSGTVQGVGFRPTVWRLAREMGRRGHVLNDGEGVTILIDGDVDAFISTLRRNAPPLARIDSIRIEPSAADLPDDFDILPSRTSQPETGIAADAATCPECLAEILAAQERRAHYAFTNCTHCGPRWTIIRAVPYDRANTSMAGFPLCPDCAREYANPADRRFHAQPIACPACGPKLWLEGGAGDAITETARLIGAGKIIAIKGLGGFHLCCDAGNEQAVAALRQRKRRDRKPMALMVRDVAVARTLAVVDEAAERLLTSPAAPIVLLRQRANTGLAAGLAPGQDRLGIMLPYTPLHHLLLRAVDRPLVMTSGNLSDEPQCTDNDDATARLGGIADHHLLHNRPIVHRADDSVVRPARRGAITIRRARGLAPAPVTLHDSFGATPTLLALGPDLKNTVTLLRGNRAVSSPHIGDLSTPLARVDYARTVELFLTLHRAAPAALACDLHPDFHSTRRAEELAAQFTVPLTPVQHHHAHIAAVMAERGLALDHAPVIGVALDGLGLGSDGTIWGGEFLLASFRGFERLAHFPLVAQPGGDRAAREPWRMAVAYVEALLGWENAVGGHAALAALKARGADALVKLCRSTLSARTTSAGRLFDAVAALLGLCVDEQNYEGEAAMLLEASAARSSDRMCYDDVVSPADWAGLMRHILDDVQRGAATSDIAARFHSTLAAMVVAEAARLAGQHGVSQVALSGGCFNNALLLDAVCDGLEAQGLEALYHRVMPPGDGGVSLGQAAVAAAVFRDSHP